MAESDVIAGLDVGTQYVRVLVSETDSNGKLIVSGWGECPAEGIRRGVVINIEAARKAVLSAVEAAEQEAGRTVTELWTSLGGMSVNSLNSRGVVGISGKNSEVDKDDIESVLKAARAVVIPIDRKILHILPQQYIIDNEGGIKDPINRIGVRLEAEVHIVTASLSSTSNLSRAVERADYRVRDTILGTLAAARALLDPDEKNQGALLIDIGLEQTNYIFIQNGAPILTGSVPVGGKHASNDLSMVLKTSGDSAEQIKLEHGRCWPDLLQNETQVQVPGIGGNSSESVSDREICRILQARMDELFHIIASQIEVESIRVGDISIILTGGGSLLPGSIELVSEVFKQSSRPGSLDKNVEWPSVCSNPGWSTAAGLVLFGHEMTLDKNEFRCNKENGTFKGFMRWLGEFF